MLISLIKKKKIHEFKNDLRALELAYYFQFDGLTKTLTAKTNVTPNTKYRLKMAIADVGDQLYDSAIFIEANSLRSTGKKPNYSIIKRENYYINFEYDSDVIKGKESFDILNNLYQYLNNNSEINIDIIGHTDQDGSKEYNYSLSTKRALSVQKHLINKGIDIKRIVIKGNGYDKPISNIKAKNRRVEVVFKHITN